MITCNGIPFTLETAISYGLPIDNLDHSLEEIIDEAQEELQFELERVSMDDNTEELEETCYDASNKLDEQIEKLDIVLDSLEVTCHPEEETVRKVSDELKNISNKLGYV